MISIKFAYQFFRVKYGVSADFCIEVTILHKVKINCRNQEVSRRGVSA